SLVLSRHPAMVRYVPFYDQFIQNPISLPTGLLEAAKCPICEDKCVDTYRLSQHVYKCHKKLPLDLRKVFQCGACGTSYTCPTLLIKHIERSETKCEGRFKLTKVTKKDIEKATNAKKPRGKK
ncbi:hypothetical protein PFISCL1PPCAC_22101, partial [Pristionchus fissidentatus]